MLAPAGHPLLQKEGAHVQPIGHIAQLLSGNHPTSYFSCLKTRDQKTDQDLSHQACHHLAAVHLLPAAEVTGLRSREPLGLFFCVARMHLATSVSHPLSANIAVAHVPGVISGPLHMLRATMVFTALHTPDQVSSLSFVRLLRAGEPFLAHSQVVASRDC